MAAGSAVMSQPSSTGSMVECLTDANSTMDLAIDSSLRTDTVTSSISRNGENSSLWSAVGTVSHSGSMAGMEVGDPLSSLCVSGTLHAGIRCFSEVGREIAAEGVDHPGESE